MRTTWPNHCIRWIWMRINHVHVIEKLIQVFVIPIRKSSPIRTRIKLLLRNFFSNASRAPAAAFLLWRHINAQGVRAIISSHEWSFALHLPTETVVTSVGKSNYIFDPLANLPIKGLMTKVSMLVVCVLNFQIHSHIVSYPKFKTKSVWALANYLIAHGFWSRLWLYILVFICK